MQAGSARFPFSNTPLTTFLDRRIVELKGRKTQRQIAAEVGYDKSSMFSMIKRGESRMPINKIPALASALEVDVAYLFRLGVQTHWPELLPVFEQVFGRQLATKNEFDLFISKWRVATGDTDPPPDPRVEAAVDRMLAELFEAT